MQATTQHCSDRNIFGLYVFYAMTTGERDWK